MISLPADDMYWWKYRMPKKESLTANNHPSGASKPEAQGENEPDWLAIDDAIENGDWLKLYIQDLKQFDAYKNLNNTQLAQSYETIRGILDTWFGEQSVTSIFGATKDVFLRGASLLKLRLILRNSNFVMSLAKKKYSFLGDTAKVTLIDLIQAGNIGLIQAVESYDPKKNAAFTTYATYWIEEAFRQYALHPMQNDCKLPPNAGPLLHRVKQFHEMYVQENQKDVYVTNVIFLRAVYEHLCTMEIYAEKLTYETMQAIIIAGQRQLSLEGLADFDGEDGQWEEMLYQLSAEKSDDGLEAVSSLFTNNLTDEQRMRLYDILNDTLTQEEFAAIRDWHGIEIDTRVSSEINQTNPKELRKERRKNRKIYQRAISKLKRSTELRNLAIEIGLLT